MNDCIRRRSMDMYSFQLRPSFNVGSIPYHFQNVNMVIKVRRKLGFMPPIRYAVDLTYQGITDNLFG